MTATADDGYFFANWTKNGIIVSRNTAYTFYVTENCNLTANFFPEGNINFADANVKALCVANWDTNGDGELSYAEAVAVTNLGNVFQSNEEITSFEELQYFVGLTSIEDYAFQGCYNLTGSLIIPNSVRWIGYVAFEGCAFIGSLSIPSSVTSIGSDAFWYCTGFTGCLTIPASVTNMEDNPFAGCSGLEQIVVDSENMYYDSRENCNAIISTYDNTLVTACNYTVVPNTVTAIGNRAFVGSSLSEIEIPNSVTIIGDHAFQYCQQLIAIEIPDHVTSIGNGAFNACTNLTTIVIPNSVTTIGSSAFLSCPNLVSVELPNSVTSIGYSTFYACYGLTSVVIPSTVTSIGNYAFAYCNSLTSLMVLAETPPTLGENAFKNVPTSNPVKVPCGHEDAYSSISWGGFSNFNGICGGTVTVVANPVEGGTVAGGGTYGAGETCTVTATANDGYVFATWTKNGTIVSRNRK